MNLDKTKIGHEPGHVMLIFIVLSLMFQPRNCMCNDLK